MANNKKKFNPDRDLIERLAVIDDAEQAAWNGMGVIRGPTPMQMARQHLRNTDTEGA